MSRGYGRKSTGFKLANSNSSAIKIGDEPFQYFKKYSNIKVAVGEDRINAVNKILEHGVMGSRCCVRIKAPLRKSN